MLLVLSILIFGYLKSEPVRQQFVWLEGQRNYDQRLAKAFDYWNEYFKQSSQLPKDDENRIKAEEALGVILALKKDYIESGKMLRTAADGFAQQEKRYNPELISALSSLANLYLETYHLDAAELCYKTILNYDNNHLEFAPNRQSVELNNLGVIAYFNALLAKDKTDQIQKYKDAENFFKEALNKSHNPKIKPNKGFREIEADILLNQSLPLRDLGYLKEAAAARIKAERMQFGARQLQLP